MILENNLALIRPVITSYHVKQSALTSPIGPNQPQHLPFIYCHVQVVSSHQASKSLY